MKNGMAFMDFNTPSPLSGRKKANGEKTAKIITAPSCCRRFNMIN
jgi:hypothetical protein